MSPAVAPDAAAAVASLEALPPLAEVGLAFTAVADGLDGQPVVFDVPLTREAQEGVADIAETTREQLAEATLLPYGPATLVPRQHWMHVAQAQAATLDAIEEAVTAHDVLPFRPEADDAPRVTMMAARFTGADGRAVTFYRVADALLEFGRSKRFGLIREGGVYGRLEPADVLLLRDDFDVVVIDGWAFFDKKPTFERAFGFLEQLRRESRDTFSAVTSALRIRGLEEFEKAATSQPQMMAKMSSIRRSIDEDPAYAEAMTMANLVPYVREHSHIHIEIEQTDDGPALVFDPTPARRFEILKLLDDDFLHSKITDREYEAGSKTQATDG